MHCPFCIVRYGYDPQGKSRAVIAVDSRFTLDPSKVVCTVCGATGRYPARKNFSDDVAWMDVCLKIQDRIRP